MIEKCIEQTIDFSGGVSSLAKLFRYQSKKRKYTKKMYSGKGNISIFIHGLVGERARVYVCVYRRCQLITVNFFGNTHATKSHHSLQKKSINSAAKVTSFCISSQHLFLLPPVLYQEVYIS